MRVFVLCTGRCGSVTLAEAFKHADNFTAGHEGRSQFHPRDRLEFPDQHIEVDNRLAWFLGELDQRYGDEPLYVHLRRDPEETARSYVERWPHLERRHDPSIMGAYAHGIHKRSEWPEEDRLDVARGYVATVTANIELFLRGRSHTSDVHLDTLGEGIGRIWDQIGASGDRAAAVRTASEHFNARKTAPTAYQRRSKAVRRAAGNARRRIRP